MKISMLNVAGALALCFTGMTLSQTGAATERPNVLLVVADDMGWTDIGSFGSEIDTPNLDALADEGVVFTDYHVSLSCSPTRAMLLSGNDNHVAGMGNMAELLTEEQQGKPGYEGHLNGRVASLAEVLRANGYHTYMGGKWHLGHGPGHTPHARGFEESLSLMYGAASHWPDMLGPLPAQPMARYMHNETVLESLPGDFYSSRSYTDFLIESIRKYHGDGKPFLAYLAFTAPHDPLHVPEPWASRYRGQYDEGYEVIKARRSEAARALGRFPVKAPVAPAHAKTRPWQSLSAEQRSLEARGMELYAGMLNNMDFHYGRLVSFLRDIGELDNTVVIFMSDNGPNPWYSEDYPHMSGSKWFAQFDNSLENIGRPQSHYAYGIGWGGASAGPLNLFKLTAAEGGIRAPLLVDGPGVKGRRQVDAFTYVWDIMPTILDMAGVDYPAEFAGRKIAPMRGRSLAETLAGASDRVYADDDFVGGDLGGKAMWGRKGDKKILWVGDPYGPGEWRLFDLAVDPGETRDLSAQQPQILAELIQDWERYAEAVGIVR